MSFISVFDVMGPNMIGPSSSHTAGAARIAYLAQKMINGPLKSVQFILYGSFAKTYHGHGTDRALLGGIMGFSTDDMRIRNSFEIATKQGLEYTFTTNEEETDIHPNTVDIIMTNEVGQELAIRGESLRKMQTDYVLGTICRGKKRLLQYSCIKRNWCKIRQDTCSGCTSFPASE